MSLFRSCCGTGFSLAAVGVDSNDHFFWRTIGATVGVAVFVEFFVNLYSMSLPVEILVQFVAVVLVLMVTVGERQPEFRSAKRLCELLLAGLGLGLLIHTASQVYMNWHQLDGSYCWSLRCRSG